MTPSDGVVVVIPVRDEALTLDAALESLARQSVGAPAIEVAVYDGLSTDGTPEVARAWAARADWRRFEVRENRARTVPHALNDALARTDSAYFTRLDGRCRLSPNYLETCLAAIPAPPAVAAVGGSFVAEAEGAIPNSIAAAVTHPLGVGKGFRTVEGDEEVPHHPFAVWRTEDVRRIGGFDPELTRNQDDEFSFRATRAGARILVASAATAHYRPRERYRGLAAQYFQYGLWKSAVGRTRGAFPPRSLAPAAVFAAELGAGVAAANRRWAPSVAFAATYLALGGVCAAPRPANPLLTAAALATVHTAYGVGVVAGALRPELTRGRLGSGRVR